MAEVQRTDGPDSVAAAHMLCTLGVLHQIKGDHPLAVELLQSGLQQGAAMLDPDSRDAFFHELGLALHMNGEHARAVATFRVVESACRAQGARRDGFLGKVLHELGSAEVQLGMPDESFFRMWDEGIEALERFIESEGTASSEGKEALLDLVAQRINRSIVPRARGDYRQAEALLLRALDALDLAHHLRLRAAPKLYTLLKEALATIYTEESRLLQPGPRDALVKLARMSGYS
jgi:tetratricopeptide (TPR) repeat protein